MFRFALERWTPDPYQALVLHRGPLDQAQQALFEKLRLAGVPGSGNLNLVVEDIDFASRLSPRQKEALGDRPAPARLPAVVLLYPHFAASKRAAFEGQLTTETVQGIIDSPARREISERLLGKDSVVWLLLQSGNRAKDQTAKARLQKRLPELATTIKLPTAADIKNDQAYQSGTQVDLKLAFSVLGIARDDRQEQVFVSILENSEEHLHRFRSEPVVIPIFGRGRSYYALVGDQIGEPAITENCRFLAGPCSCQVKRDNPGVDLLFAADWDTRVLGTAVPERPAPPLAALGQLRPPGAEPLAVAAQKPLADPVERLAADARNAPSLIGWAIGLAATGTVASVAFAGLVMGMRRKRKR